MSILSSKYLSAIRGCLFFSSPWCCCSVTKSCPTLQFHPLPHTRLSWPLFPRVCSNSCPFSQWCHPTISSSVVPFSSCLQSFPASGSFPMSQFFAPGGQSIEVSASVLHYRGLECKSMKSRITWGNRQIWPWSTEWSSTKNNRVLQREHTGHSKHPLPITQEETLHMDITRWSTLKSDWLYSLQPKVEKLYTVSKNKTRR